MKTVLKSLLVGASFLAIAGSAGATNLITNGGFSNGLSPNGGFATLGSGSTAINGWTVVGGSVDWIQGYWQSSDGDGFSVDLNGNSPGGVAQTINTVVGQSYTLTFDMSGNPDSFRGETRIAVIGAGGATIGAASYTLTGANTRANMLWQNEVFNFVATGATTEIRFTSGNGGDNCCFGGAIDNVAVGTAVPEPATWAMLIVGFGGVGAIARRRRAAALA